ncbi:uncharacterized protein LOC142327751 [Lycorma delicatula]|uniref:uncharacterized protein LOC142327751 n=1 Tax=Lycorma delicatula TaxID=130591 RepID=UPI003F510A20
MPDADNNNPRSQPLETERSKQATYEPQAVTTNVIVPPDGGWGWVIVFGSFFCNVFVDGIVYCFGVLLGEITRSLGENKAKVSLVGSLLSGFYLVAGPFVSALANRYGFRLVTILGSIIACIAFVISSFATNVEFLILWYGIIGGIGFGMIYVPAVLTTGFYFEKWRALATGIAVCGSGIGTFVLAPFTTYLIREYGWRGAILIQGGLVLNCAVFGALFRPLRSTKITVVNDDHNDLDADRNSVYRTQTSENSNIIPLLMRIKMARQRLEKASSLHSIDHETELAINEPSEIKNHILKANNNVLYPTVKQILNSMDSNLNKSCHSLHTTHHRMKKTSFDSSHRTEKRMSVPIYPENCRGSPQKIRHNTDDEETLNNCHPDEALLKKPMNDDVFCIQKSIQNGKVNGIQTNKENNGVHYRSRTMSNSSSYHSSRSRSRRMTEAANRPLYRDDIFFGASLNRLPQYMSHVSGLDYTMSVTRLPTWHDLEEEEKGCKLCPEAVRRILATMLDISLLQSPTFLLLCVSGFITMMGFFVPFMFLADRAEQIGGMDTTLSVWLVSTIGITNTFGRVGCGILTSLPGVNALVINNIALTIGGIATILSGISMTPVYQYSYAAVFGLAISCFASLRSIIIVDLIGLEKLTNAFGILLLFQGLAAAIGAPIASIFMEKVGNYDASFYLSGGLLLISGIMCYPLNWLNKWEKRKQQQSTTANSPKVI